MQPHHIDFLLKDISLGKRIIFEKKLHDWQNVVNVTCTQSSVTKFNSPESIEKPQSIADKSNKNKSNNEVRIHKLYYLNTTYLLALLSYLNNIIIFIEKVSLSSILERTVEGRGLLKLKNSTEKLSDANERILCDKITDYFIQNEINMQTDDYLHISNQIALYFPAEVKVNL